MSVAVAALALLELLAGPQRSVASAPEAALALAVVLPLVWRTTYPLVFATLSTGAFALGSLAVPTVELFVVSVVVFFVAPFAVAARAGRWRTAISGGALVVLLLLLQGVWDERYGTVGAALANAVYGTLGWGVGAAVRAVEQRSEDRVAHAEREAVEAVRAERAAMARDLHDVVSNALTVVAVQSGGALTVLDADPTQARRALEDIRDVARQAMVDMRHLLGLLRDEALEEDVIRRPGLADLDDLVAPLRSAGITVSLGRSGTPSALTPGTETTAVRVLQEALTNVVRHSSARSATVTVRCAADGLWLDVVDEGPEGRPVTVPEPDRLPSGHGLVGMRERVDLLGGRLEVGPVAAGGWRVSAWLPVDRAGEWS